MKKDKENNNLCTHCFKIDKITTEQENYGGSSTAFFYKKIAYVVCEKCGLVIKQDI